MVKRCIMGMLVIWFTEKKRVTKVMHQNQLDQNLEMAHGLLIGPSMTCTIILNAGLMGFLMNIITIFFIKNIITIAFT